MNNSFLAINNVSLELDTPLDNTVHFRERETELVKIIDALTAIAESKEWKILEDTIFKDVVKNLLRDRDREASVEQSLNGPKIHNLNGQIKWARKYLDLSSLASIYKQELVNVRNQLNGK